MPFVKPPPLNIIEKYDKPFVYAGVVFNLILAWQFYLLWSQPQDDQAAYIITMATLMGFEFIMVHSGVFMAVFPRKWSLLIFFPFYGIFALSFAATMTDGYIVLVTYLIAVFNRMRFAFADVPQHFKSRSIFTSVLAALTYFILIFIVAFGAEAIPKWGLTQDFLERSRFFDGVETGGILIDMPQTAMCLGVMYYLILAIIELFLAKKMFTKVSSLFPESRSPNKNPFFRGRKKL